MTKTSNVFRRLFPLVIAIIVLLAVFIVIRLSFLGSNIEDSEVILFLGNKNIAPIVYYERGEAKGIVVDIVNELGKKIGYKVKVEAIDWEEAQSKVLLGDADAVVQINPNSVRLEVFDFSDELLKSEFSIFIRSGNVDIKSIADLKGRTVGVESGGFPCICLQQYEGIDLEIIPDWKTGFTKTASGKLDAVVVDRWIGEYELAKSRIKGIEIIEEPIETQYSRIAVRKGDSELLSLINAGLKKMNDDGTMAEIIGKWKGKRVVYLTEERLRESMLYAVVGFLIFVLLTSLYWVNKFRKLSKDLEVQVIQRTQELDSANELLRKANAELEKISMVDELTNILNRRGFDIAFQKSWEFCLRDEKPLALIMIDIDNFKFFNDTYGHLAGDQCLRRVASEIESVAMKKQGIVTRYGGEEFLVILQNFTEEEAADVAEDMRKSIEDLRIYNEQVNSVITISLGVAAATPGESMDSEELINAADEALYKAKGDGRNIVVKSSSS